MANFIYNYLRSMRLYYCFVSGTTTLAGVAFYHILSGKPWGWRDAVILSCGFFAWGINQIFNDYFDLESDRINAPCRPMAAGKLDIKKALLLSTVLMLILGGASLAVAPAALPAVIVGAVLNLLYSKLKSIPVVNCLVYGASLSCCAWFGYAGLCGTNWEKAFSPDALIVSLLVLPIHVFMCSISYYKDKEGDRAAGVRTLQNLFPDEVTLPLHILVLGVMLCLFLRVHYALMIPALLLLPLAAELFFFLFQEEYHSATKVNCQLCAVWCASLWGEANPYLYLVAVIAFFGIEVLYLLNGNDNKRFVTGFEKLLFYAGMSLRCAVKLRSLSALWKGAQFTRIFFCHKLLQLPSGEYKLDFYMPRYPTDAFFTAMKDKLISTPPRPVSVVWSITSACAYRCPHCYQGFDPAEEMPLEKMCQAAREVRNFGVTAWAVEGGEPLLRFARLTALLEELRGLEVWVNSTGHSATPEKIARLKELEVTGIMSSIHSVSPGKHDAFTGVKGSFDTALEFLSQCRKAGMLTGFNTVLSDQEIMDGEIDNIMALAQEHKCDYIQLIHPKICGRWGKEKFDSSLHEKAVKIACEAQKKYNSSRKKNAPILTAQVFEESPEMLGCTAGGIDRFYVGCSGEVQPCEFVNISFGNLCHEPFSAIYERMRRVFPVPSCDWLCGKYGECIADAVAKNGGKTPLPWGETLELVKDWKSENPTPVYKKMGIYK